MTRRRRRPRTLGGLIGLAALVAAAAIGALLVEQNGPDAPSADAPAVTEAGTDLSPATALARLKRLEVKPATGSGGYDRVGDFGEAWIDVDGNGCDTRSDVLRRDLVDVTLENRCKVDTGILHDPYSGRTIHYVRGPVTSQAVQIDHVVALADAWRTGARPWTKQRREQFANDPLELLAVDGPTNNKKGDADAASWLPPSPGYRCAYAARQVAVKTRYGLWVTPAERAALQTVLTACNA